MVERRISYQSNRKSNHKPQAIKKQAVMQLSITACSYLLMAERVGFEIEVQLFEIIIENIFYFQNVIFYTQKYAQNF